MVDMEYEILIDKKLIERIKKLGKKHVAIVKKLIKKLKERGLRSAKHLYSVSGISLYEMKSRSPPYRLYVIKEKHQVRIVDWVHKEKQKIFIRNLKKSLFK